MTVRYPVVVATDTGPTVSRSRGEPIEVMPSGHTSLPVGSTLLVGVQKQGGGGVSTGTITDARGNTYTPVGRAISTAGAGTLVDVWVSTLTTALQLGDLVTYTASVGDSDREVCLAVVWTEGVDPVNPVDSFTVVNQGSGTNPTGDPVSVTRTDDRPYVVAFVPHGSSTANYNAQGGELADLNSATRGLAVETNAFDSASGLTITSGGVLSESTSWAVFSVVLRPIDTGPHAPTADAGRNRVTKVGDVELLDGSRSVNAPEYFDELPPSTLTYSWVQLAGPSVAITDADQPVASYTVPDGVPGVVFDFRLTVSNDRGAADTATVRHERGPVLPTAWLWIQGTETLPAIFEVVQIDPDAPAPPADADRLVLDGLSIQWLYANPDEQVNQLEPMVAKVQVSTLDVDNVAVIRAAGHAAVLVFDEYDRHVASVFGRIGEAKAKQTRTVVGGVPRMRTTVALDVVDFTATENRVIDELVRPAESIDDRFDALRDAADPGLSLRMPPGEEPSAAVMCRTKARAADYKGVQLLDVLREMLFEAPLNADGDGAQYVGHMLLVPIVDDDTWLLSHISVHVMPGMPNLFTLASTYRWGAEHYEIPDPDHPHVIPADRVDIDGDYQLAANDDPTVVVVNTRDWLNPANDVTVVYDSGRPFDVDVVKVVDHRHMTRDVQPFGSSFPDTTAQMHHPANGASVDTGWNRDGFTYRPDTFHDIAGGFFPCFLRELGGWRVTGFVEAPRPFELAAPCFRVPVVVEGIPDAGSLARSDGRYCGHLLGATLTIEAGRPVVDFELRRAQPYEQGVWDGPTLDPNEIY